jgi:hypothetical protein
LRRCTHDEDPKAFTRGPRAGFSDGPGAPRRLTAVRKEGLKRLLVLNQQRAKEEDAKAPAAKAKDGNEAIAKVDPNQPDLI